MTPATESAAVVCTAPELRLRKHADFQRVYNATKKQHAKQMSFFAARREVLPGEYAGPRVGLTVGKVMGKAHVRNRIKRRLREALRAEYAALGGLAVDVILHPRRTVETLPMDELRAEVAWVFRKSSKSASQRVSESAGRSVKRSAGQQTAVGDAPVSGSDVRRAGGAGDRAHGSAVRADDASKGARSAAAIAAAVPAAAGPAE